MTYTLHIGDAWTDPAVIQLKPLPVIEPQLSTTPPSYAAGTQPAETTTSRQLAVLEGTKIDLKVVCTNKKELFKCSLRIKNQDGWDEVPMKAADKSGFTWIIADEATNPFNPIREELHYERRSEAKFASVRIARQSFPQASSIRSSCRRRPR